MLRLHPADESVVHSPLLTKSAILNLASSAPSGQRRIPCRFEGIEGNRLTVELWQGVPLFAVVSVECEDELFLGEVLSSVPTTEGSWRAEVKVERVLNGLQSLLNLRSKLLGADVRRAPALSFAGVYA